MRIDHLVADVEQASLPEVRMHVVRKSAGSSFPLPAADE
jgi:hypothetical protein